MNATKDVVTGEAAAVLRDVAQAILMQPAALEMGQWYIRRSRVENPPRCGAVACVAGHCALRLGWTTLQADGDVEQYLPVRMFPEGSYVRTQASNHLRPGRVHISDAVAWWIAEHANGRVPNYDRGAHPLFYVGSWPYEFGMRYQAADDANDQQALAIVTAERIEHFIRTGK